MHYFECLKKSGILLYLVGNPPTTSPLSALNPFFNYTPTYFLALWSESRFYFNLGNHLGSPGAVMVKFICTRHAYLVLYPLLVSHIFHPIEGVEGVEGRPSNPLFSPYLECGVPLVPSTIWSKRNPSWGGSLLRRRRQRAHTHRGRGALL